MILSRKSTAFPRNRIALIQKLTFAVLAIILGMNNENVYAHDLYIMNDNHTDYGWNATTEEYDAAMAQEVDYYLKQIESTQDKPRELQSKFSFDSWWYLRNYREKRSKQDFEILLNAIRSGHITVPLNPFVLLYGALSTEAAIRAGYYPGRIERQYGIQFPLAQYVENHTSPWGIASLWAGSGVNYAWKGVCGCVTKTPFQLHQTPLFRWQGPDNQHLLKKWYPFEGRNTAAGGYAEARSTVSLRNFATLFEEVDAAVAQTETRSPNIPLTALFGAGQDDVVYETQRVVRLAESFNWIQDTVGFSAGKPIKVTVSNGIDFFRALEPHSHDLPILRGGWGNDWDVLPARLAHWTTRIRTSFERLRLAEFLLAFNRVHAPAQSVEASDSIDEALIGLFKYFEHSWSGTRPELTNALLKKKKLWAETFESTIASIELEASLTLSESFNTPDEQVIAVMNPLAFPRTDYVDVHSVDLNSVRVVDIVSGEIRPSQLIIRDGETRLRFLASNVPGLGYRLYRLDLGASPSMPLAATIHDQHIENELYALELGSSGEILRAIDKRLGRELAGQALNFVQLDGNATFVAESIGPVSATLRADVDSTPPRMVQVTLFKDLDRIEVTNQILGIPDNETHYVFDFGFDEPSIHFEEVGAIARPGAVDDGGDFLPGTNAKYMTLNHFVNLSDEDYNITLSNWDSFMMTFGNSSPEQFELPTNRIAVLGVGPPDVFKQGDASGFVHRFALRGSTRTYSGVRAMRFALAHQNPLHAIALPRNQVGPLTKSVDSLVSLDSEDVVAMAFKVAEEPHRGYILRVWDLSGHSTRATVDVSALDASEGFETSLIETDIAPLRKENGRFVLEIPAHSIKTYRFSN